MSRSMRRRNFLLGSAALASHWGCLHSAWAQSSGSITVPVVDRLNIKVLTDSSYDTPRPPSSPWVKIRRAGLAAPGNFRKTLHNEWGLALALESQAGGQTRTLMLNFGYTVEALANNMDIMGVDPSKEVQALTLSHGHFDHFGGLLAFLQHNRARLPSSLTLYAGGGTTSVVACRVALRGSSPSSACSTAANSRH